jgi:hypothetical protein
MKNVSRQGVLTPAIELWNFGSPGGLPSPHFSSVSVILTLFQKWGCNKNPLGIEVVKICLVGTHNPSITLMSIINGRNFTPLMNYMGTTCSGCVPNNIKKFQCNRLYILVGLKNDILLHYKWPSISTLVAPLSLLQST